MEKYQENENVNLLIKNCNCTVLSCEAEVKAIKEGVLHQLSKNVKS